MQTPGQNRTRAVNPWVIALAVTLATFMEMLETSAANESQRKYPLWQWNFCGEDRPADRHACVHR